MATIYLHIGLPKTGTTAIQKFLGSNRKTLENHGICFPDLGRRYSRVNQFRNGHFLIESFEDTSIDRKDLNRAGADYLSRLDQIAEIGKRFEKIILTDESLWRLGDRFPEFWKKLFDDLKQRSLELRVIVYLRRQDNFALSFYRQKVKGIRTGLLFKDYLKQFRSNYSMDYLSYLDMLSECIGKDHIIVRVYEKEQYQGEEHNLLSDFLDIFGLSLKDGFEVAQQKYNLTLYGPRFELQRILNTLPVSPYKSALLKESFQSMQKNNPYPEELQVTSFFKPGEQTAYLESFSDSNRRLAQKYLGREDGELFYNKEDIELSEYEVDTDALLQDTILLYGRAIQLMEDEIHSLRKELRGEIREVRENVILYRLKRKLRHLFGKA